MNRANSANTKAKKFTTKNKSLHKVAKQKTPKRKIATRVAPRPTPSHQPQSTIVTSTPQQAQKRFIQTPVLSTPSPAFNLTSLSALTSLHTSTHSPLNRTQRRLFQTTTRLLSQPPPTPAPPQQQQPKVVQPTSDAAVPVSTETKAEAAPTTDAKAEPTSTTDTTTTTTTTEPPKKQSKFKQIYSKYGKLAIHCYFGVYFSTLALLAVGVNFIPGFDAQVPIQMVRDGHHFDTQFAFFDRSIEKYPAAKELLETYPKQFANFGAAWCLTKLTEPVRVIVTGIVTKYIGDKREKAKQAAEAVVEAKDEKAI